MQRPEYFYEITRDTPWGGRLRFQDEPETRESLPARAQQLDFCYEITQGRTYNQGRMHFQSEPDFVPAREPALIAPDREVVAAPLKPASPQPKRGADMREERGLATRETLDLHVNV